MVGTVAATSAVSAKQDDKSDIRQYDVYIRYGPYAWIPYGKLIIDSKTGHYVYTANYGKLSTENKDLWKERVDEGIAEGETITITTYTDKEKVRPGDPYRLCFGSAKLNSGGTVHAEGYLNEAPILAWVEGQGVILFDSAGVVPWLDRYGEDATFSLVFWSSYPPI